MGLQDAVALATGQEYEEEETEETIAPERQEEPGSVLAAVRARAAQLATENTVELEIPGYNGVLVGRYRAVSISRFYTPGSNGQLRNPLTEWGVAADALATALVGLYGRNHQGELEPLAFDREVRFDDDLVALLGLQVAQRSARAVLVALCGGGEKGQSRLWSHFLTYQTWLMEGAAQEVAEDAAGES
jgi:hypothetical protein